MIRDLNIKKVPRLKLNNEFGTWDQLINVADFWKQSAWLPRCECGDQPYW